MIMDGCNMKRLLKKLFCCHINNFEGYNGFDLNTYLYVCETWYIQICMYECNIRVNS